MYYILTIYIFVGFFEQPFGLEFLGFRLRGCHQQNGCTKLRQSCNHNSSLSLWIQLFFLSLNSASSYVSTCLFQSSESLCFNLGRVKMRFRVMWCNLFLWQCRSHSMMGDWVPKNSQNFFGTAAMGGAAVVALDSSSNSPSDGSSSSSIHLGEVASQASAHREWLAPHQLYRNRRGTLLAHRAGRL